MMFKLLGMAFVMLIIDVVVCAIDYCINGTFMYKFVQDQSLPIMGMLLGLNFTAASFLMGQMTNIEMKLRKKVFTNTRREIKDNLDFMMWMFFLNFVFILFLPSGTEALFSFSWWRRYIFISGSMDALLLSFYCFYENIKLSFRLSEELF